MFEMRTDTQAEDIINLLVEDPLRQAKGRYLAEHKPAALELLIEKMDLVTERGKIACDGERGRARADQGHLLSIWRKWPLGHVRKRIFTIIGRNTLESANSNGLLVDPPAPTGGLARPVTSTPENTGKHIGIPVDHVCLGIAPFGDQTNILRHRRMGWTCILAVHHLVEILGIFYVSWFQKGRSLNAENS
jgi:hypothetical protein